MARGKLRVVTDRPSGLGGSREILLPREAWWLLPRERQRRSIGQEERGHGLVSIMHVFPPKRTKRMYEITGRHIRWLGHLALDGWMHGSHLLLLIRRQKKKRSWASGALLPSLRDDRGTVGGYACCFQPAVYKKEIRVCAFGRIPYTSLDR